MTPSDTRASRSALIAAGILVAALSIPSLTACGSDHSSGEQSYLDALHKPSKYVTHDWPDDDTLITQAHQICTDISGPDITSQQDTHHISATEAVNLRDHVPGFADYPLDQISYLMGYAHGWFCPQAKLRSLIGN